MCLPDQRNALDNTCFNEVSLLFTGYYKRINVDLYGVVPRYIATLAYRHEIVKNGFSSMLIPPV